MSLCSLTDRQGNRYLLSLGHEFQPADPGEYYLALEVLERIDGDQLFCADLEIFHFHNIEFHQRLALRRRQGRRERRLGDGWQYANNTEIGPYSRPGGYPGRWAIILDAIYHGDLRFTQIASAPQTQTSAEKDKRGILRVRIRQALAAIVAQESAEAARHEQLLREETRISRTAIYTGAFLTGLWNAGTDLAQWLKEVNDVVNPLHRSLRGIQSSYRVLQRNSDTGEELLAAFADEILTAEKRELVQVLGFDPGAITREQFHRATEMADLIWEDPALQADLRRFIKDYVKAQHPIEITEFSGAAAFEVLFTILLAAVTGGAGLAAGAAGQARHFAKFRKVGELLMEFAGQARKAKTLARHNSGNNRKASFEDFESLGEVESHRTAVAATSIRKEKPARREKIDTELEIASKEHNGKSKLDDIFRKIPESDYLAIKARSVHNLDSNTLVLGKYRPTVTNGVEDWSTPGPDSYVAIARTENATYFDLGSEWSSITAKYELSDDEMFRAFNIPVLDDAVNTNKQIKFTHDPRTNGGFLQQEWEYLQKVHGYKRLKEIDGAWYAK